MSLVDMLELSYGAWAAHNLFCNKRVISSEMWVTMMQPLLTSGSGGLAQQVCFAFREYLLSIGVLGITSTGTVPSEDCGKSTLPDPGLRAAPDRPRVPSCVTCGRTFGRIYRRRHRCSQCENEFCGAHVKAPNLKGLGGAPADPPLCQYCQLIMPARAAAATTTTTTPIAAAPPTAVAASTPALVATRSGDADQVEAFKAVVLAPFLVGL